MLDNIKTLVGENITEENLTFIDSFVSKKLALFIPIGGSCGYAVTPWHIHPSYMFLLPYDNETTIVLEDKKLELNPKTLFCLSPYIAHHEIQNYFPPKYCAVFIEKDFFEASFSNYQDKIKKFDGDIIVLQSLDLEFQIEKFLQESNSEYKNKKDLLELLAELLTHEIIRTIISKPKLSVQLTQNQRINEVVKYINAYFETNLTLLELAQKVNLSKSHLSKLFGKEMGVSVMEYLKNVRLTNAKKMLLSQSLSVTQVAQQCGFNSPSYFTKLFKEKYNQTPKELLKR
jgi:AraC-like DNA-binding protein